MSPALVSINRQHGILYKAQTASGRPPYVCVFK